MSDWENEQTIFVSAAWKLNGHNISLMFVAGVDEYNAMTTSSLICTTASTPVNKLPASYASTAIAEFCSALDGAMAKAHSTRLCVPLITSSVPEIRGSLHVQSQIRSQLRY